MIAVAVDVGQEFDGLFNYSNEFVSGDVRLKMYAGHCWVTGRRSETSLYDFDMATYDEGDTFDQSLAKGLVDLWGLPTRIASARNLKAK